MGIHNDRWINEFGAAGGIFPFKPECVNPASYDLTLGNEVVVLRSGEPPAMYNFDSVETVLLAPGESALVVSAEVVRTPNDVAITGRLKSSASRQLIFSSMGMFVDPGYSGSLTFTLVNMGQSSYELKAGRRVMQIVFHSLNETAQIPYGDSRRESHYQNSDGLTLNKSKL